MPYSTGIASRFDDFQVLDEVIAVGDGIQTSFTVDIAEEKGQIDSFAGDYVIGVTPHTFTTDVDGNITGTDLTGTFDGKTANFTFTSAPTGDIEVDYISQGVLSQVVDFATNRKTKSEVIGTGDGVQTTFNFSLANFPVAPGQLLIRARIGGTYYLAYPQSGLFDHPQISGTINETTGVGSITTTSPVDNTIDIEAIYSDSATPGRDWILLREETTRDASGNEEYPGDLLKQVWLKNSGFSGKVNNNEGGITVAFRECRSTGTNSFAIQGNFWRIFSDIHYTSADFLSNNADVQGSYSGNGSLINMPTCNFAESNLTWFCSATKNHIFLCVRSLGTIYSQLCQGCGNPMSSFLVYPKPFFSKGSASSLSNISGTNFTGVHKSGVGDVIYARQDGSFNPGTQTYKMLPRDNFNTTTRQLKNTTDDKVLLRPVLLYDPIPNKALFELPGIKFCPSNKISPEDVLRDEGLIDHDVFIQHNEVDEEDFFCVDKAL